MPIRLKISIPIPNYGAYKHLLKLYRTLAQGIESGSLLEPAIDWLKSEIHQLERDLGLQK